MGLIKQWRTIITSEKFASMLWRAGLTKRKETLITLITQAVHSRPCYLIRKSSD
jgi:hypothetical protein